MSIEVYPVVHVQTKQQAVEQTDIALSAGADGVYLIDHGSHVKGGLLTAYNAVVEAQPDAFIGLNFLNLGTGFKSYRYLQEALNKGVIDRLPNGVWVDDAGYDREKLVELRASDPRLQSVRYLGGTAFKYTRGFTEDPVAATQAAKEMSPFVDVVTTSGAGTGTPPTPEKIHAMKQAIGEQPLAVASGIDSDNIAQFKGGVDQILVASSVETVPYSGIFDEAKLKDFIDTAHSL